MTTQIEQSVMLHGSNATNHVSLQKNLIEQIIEKLKSQRVMLSYVKEIRGWVHN